MSSTVRTVGGRVDLAPVTALVALGDLGCIGTFVVAGEISHDVDPVANPLYVAETAIPFLIGWALVASLAGLYATDARRSARRAVALTVPGWASAALVAQALRATPMFHGGAAVTFYLVSVGVCLALLVPWRVATSRLFPAEQ